MKNNKPTKEELEEFKKKYLERIQKVAENKTAWIEDFKEVYQEKRKPKSEQKTVKDYANRL